MSFDIQLLTKDKLAVLQTVEQYISKIAISFGESCGLHLQDRLGKQTRNGVKFEVFTAVTMKNAFFWDVKVRVLVKPTIRRNVTPSSSG
jgi:hypothetical protein